MLHRLVRRSDAPFASLKDGVGFAMKIMKCDYLKRVITSTEQGISAKLTSKMLYAIELSVTLGIYMEATSGFLCEEVVFSGLIDLESKVKKTKEYTGTGVNYF